jgi:hypothetical protein
MNIMKRIWSSFVKGGGSALLPQRRMGRGEIDTRDYSSRGVIRKIETTSA